MKALASVLSAMLMAGAAPALAQQTAPARPERPYRGLFGGGVGDSEQLVTLNFSLGGGYDDNVLADGPSGSGTTDPRQARGGSFSSVAGELSFSLNRTRAGLLASVASSGRYFPDLEPQFLASHSGSIGASFQVSKSSRLSASHTTSYQPYLILGLLPQLFEVPGQAIPPRHDLGIEQTEYFTHSSGIDFSQAISRRASLSFNYSYLLADFRTAQRDFSNQGGGGRFTLGLAKGLSFRIGYGYAGVLYGAREDGRLQRHNADVGVDFNRALSFSRRTTVSFATGTAAIVDHERTYYRLIGNARLNREVGRTWMASIGYERTAGFIESFSGPVFADSLVIGYGGMINNRLQFSSSAGASIGQFGFDSAGHGFDTYMGSAGLTLGLTRYLGLDTRYSYYRYAFEPEALLPPGVSRQLNRQSVEARLTIWVPIVNRARRSDASR